MAIGSHFFLFFMNFRIFLHYDFLYHLILHIIESYSIFKLCLCLSNFKVILKYPKVDVCSFIIMKYFNTLYLHINIKKHLIN